jgi:hypothetical protein
MRGSFHDRRYVAGQFQDQPASKPCNCAKGPRNYPSLDVSDPSCQSRHAVDDKWHVVERRTGSAPRPKRPSKNPHRYCPRDKARSDRRQHIDTTSPPQNQEERQSNNDGVSKRNAKHNCCNSKRLHERPDNESRDERRKKKCGSDGRDWLDPHSDPRETLASHR